MVVWEQLEKSRGMLEACAGRVKCAGISAINHIQMAQKIEGIDPQMACFRAITAEEEAATSLLASLRDQGYPHSDKYHLWSHENKAGVIVFIKAVVSWFSESFLFEHLPVDQPRMVMTDEPGRPAVELLFPLKGMEKCLRPRPPLDVRAEGLESMKDVIGRHLRKELKRELSAEIRGVIKDRANQRNHLLYASNDGLPGCFSDVNGFILNQAAIVNALITAVGLIDPWRKPKYRFSGLVEAALEEYVHIMSAGRRKST